MFERRVEAMDFPLPNVSFLVELAVEKDGPNLPKQSGGMRPAHRPETTILGKC